MNAHPEEQSLYVGLVSLDSRTLISPPGETPQLFTGPYVETPRLSIEAQAWMLLREQGMVTSRVSTLRSMSQAAHKGYLLRESQRITDSSKSIQRYTLKDLLDYTEVTEPDNVHGHFLRQIARHMH